MTAEQKALEEANGDEDIGDPGDTGGMGFDGGVLIALEDGIEVQAPAEVVDTHLPDKTVSVFGMPRVTVRFDNFSHQSAHRRAFVTCPLHENCRKWCFVRSHGSPERAVAFLAAWVRDGMQWTLRGSGPLHIPWTPESSLVDMMEAHASET